MMAARKYRPAMNARTPELGLEFEALRTPVQAAPRSWKTRFSQWLRHLRNLG